jgi:hypothetical protein
VYYSTSKSLKASPEKSQILSYDIVVLSQMSDMLCLLIEKLIVFNKA